MEYNNRGEGAKTAGRVAWSRQLTKKEAEKITLATVMGGWMPQQ
jgi:pectinesterase